MPTAVINEMRGVNADKAALQLKPGEFVNLSNVRSRPTQNLAKRRGIEPVSSQDSPYWGIMDFCFDDMPVSVTMNGDRLTFNDPLVSDSNPGGVGGNAFDENPFSQLDPGGTNVPGTGGLLIEPAMRALNDRKDKASIVLSSWPPSLIAADGTDRNVDPGAYPRNGFYAYDLAYADTLGYDGGAGGIKVDAGSAQGTFATALVNYLRTEFNGSAVAGAYVNPGVAIAGAADITYYTVTGTNTIQCPVAATVATHRSILSLLRPAICRMNLLKVTASQTGQMKRTGTHTATPATPGYYIDGWGTITWVDNYSGGPYLYGVPYTGPGLTANDGTLTKQSSGALTQWGNSQGETKVFSGNWITYPSNFTAAVGGGNLSYATISPSDAYPHTGWNWVLEIWTKWDATSIGGINPETQPALYFWKAGVTGDISEIPGNYTQIPEFCSIWAPSTGTITVKAYGSAETCTDIKTAAQAQFGGAGDTSTSDDIGTSELTSTDTATLTNVYGRVTADLSDYVSPAAVYLKLKAQTDGSSNVPTGSTLGVWAFIENTNCGATYTATNFFGEQDGADFTAANLCPAISTTYGWVFDEACVVAMPKLQYFC